MIKFGKKNLPNTCMNRISIFCILISLSFGNFASTDKDYDFKKDAYPFESEIKEELFYSLLFELRCPKCQSSNLAGSNSPISNDLKREVYELIKKDKSSDQIKTYLVERYGNFIIYNPPIEPATYVLWFGPLALILISIFSILFFRKRQIQ
jgi:cytochrome c-type biogenesis protein CcmH